MRVVLNSHHLAPVGGGENYLMRLAMALDDRCDFYINHNFLPGFEDFNGFGREFKIFNGLWTPDVFLHCSHLRPAYPIGRKNYEIVFYPKRDKGAEGYDGVVTICDYSALFCVDKWKPKRVDIIYPAIDASLYNYDSTQKRNQIISIGHFFEEPDGHSKNQHILAQAFTPRLAEAGFELVLVGAAGQEDAPYINKVRKCAEGKNIRIEINKDDKFLKSELSRSRFLWHGNGYGRTDPAQVEHFGIIVLEALASGVIPIVYNSGGAREIAGITWNEPADLERLTLELDGVPRLEEKYTVPHFEREVDKWLKSIV